MEWGVFQPKPKHKSNLNRVTDAKSKSFIWTTQSQEEQLAYKLATILYSESINAKLMSTYRVISWIFFSSDAFPKWALQVFQASDQEKNNQEKQSEWRMTRERETSTATIVTHNDNFTHSNLHQSPYKQFF